MPALLQYTSVTFQLIWNLPHCSKHAGTVTHCTIVMVTPLTAFYYTQKKADLAKTAFPTFVYECALQIQGRNFASTLPVIPVQNKVGRRLPTTWRPVSVLWQAWQNSLLLAILVRIGKEYASPEVAEDCRQLGCRTLLPAKGLSKTCRTNCQLLPNCAGTICMICDLQ